MMRPGVAPIDASSRASALSTVHGITDPVKKLLAHVCVIDDGRLAIDNGVAERALRGVAVVRRNWLFAGSLAGGERAAALYTVIETVIETAKANGVEPQAYIADVLAKLAFGWPAVRRDEFMPWNWWSAATPLDRAA